MGLEFVKANTEDTGLQYRLSCMAATLNSVSGEIPRKWRFFNWKWGGARSNRYHAETLVRL